MKKEVQNGRKRRNIFITKTKNPDIQRKPSSKGTFIRISKADVNMILPLPLAELTSTKGNQSRNRELASITNYISPLNDEWEDRYEEGGTLSRLTSPQNIHTYSGLACNLNKPPSRCISSRGSLRNFTFLSSKQTPKLQNFVSSQDDILELKQLIEQDEHRFEKKCDESTNIYDEAEADLDDALLGNNFQGEKGLKTFYGIYKKSSRMNEYIQEKGLKRLGTATMDYLKCTDKFKLPPRTLGVVQRNVTSLKKLSTNNDKDNTNIYKKKKARISIGQFSIGDKYALAMSHSLPSIKLKTLELNNNRLSNSGVLPILRNLAKTVKTLNLAKNNLTVPSYRLIAQIITDEKYQLQELILEKNKGRNEGAKLISNALVNNSKIYYINLSGNGITDIGAEFISDMLKINVAITTLFLRWNLVKGKGGGRIAQAMSTNNSVRVLDISYNNLGISKSNESSKIWKSTFEENKTLIHLDLSHNKFILKDIEYMRDGITDNHTLLGIHLAGNEGFVDGQGFLYPKSNANPGVSSTLTFRISSKPTTGTLPCEGFHRMNALSNCWICEGWREIKFEFIPSQMSNKILTDFDNIYLHLSFEDYWPDLMLENTTQSPLKERVSIRMVPPGNIYYFFSIENQVILDNKKPIKDLSKPAKVKVELLPTLIYDVETSKANYIKNEIVKGNLMSRFYVRNMKCKIRPPAKFPNIRNRVKTPWSLPISIFWGYVSDNEELLCKCFENDWNSIRIPRAIIKEKEELNAIKDKMKSSFKTIRESYKQFAAVDPCNGVFAIGMNVCTDIFANHCKIIDENLKLTDLDLDFVQSNTPLIKTINPRNPDRYLIRFNYLELIVRLALRKYYSKANGVGYSDAVRILIDNEFLPAFAHVDCHEWRKNKLWIEENDSILKFHRPLLNSLFEKFSGAKALPGNPPFVSLDEFIAMVKTSGVIDEDFGEREINGLYNLSMMTQVDEITNERHLQMFKLEFHEAVCRVADKLCISSPYDNATYTKEQLKGQAMWVKIKNFLETLLTTTMSDDYIKHYEKTVMKVKKDQNTANLIKKLVSTGTGGEKDGEGVFNIFKILGINDLTKTAERKTNDSRYRKDSMISCASGIGD